MMDDLYNLLALAGTIGLLCFAAIACLVVAGLAVVAGTTALVRGIRHLADARRARNGWGRWPT
ncbi:hypothetical protein [Rhodococcus pyridinivorans]|uniref:Uncharacterized protein n=1 Tax=Rhodococcus pyridinivorans TaxID=103816 RepID=A0A7M2XP66_9NOCA|nr:hypothetical protein [Rhodococcus pyridinivorans]QOV99529.1 hypothetical protein INP59_03765 [Rhodococcus pyridinivorans]